VLPFPRIEFIAVGSELLSGRLNTHVVFLAQKLTEIGLSLSREVTVGDDSSEMVSVFREALKRSDVIITSGGLGPTFDDLTREAWAEALGKRFVRQEELVRDIFERYAQRGYKAPQENARQGDVIEGAEVIHNQVGTAPGQMLALDRKFIFLLPGPPQEMYPMVLKVVIPQLAAHFPARVCRVFTLHTFGIPESIVAEQIDSVIRKERTLPEVEVSFTILAHSFMVDIKATVIGDKKKTVDEVSNEIRQEFLTNLQEDVFGHDGQTLEGVVGDLLKRKKMTVSVAESCTGGLLAERLTRVAGSSSYFLQGVVTYSNEAKKSFLGVSEKTLKDQGAVSESCAREMVQGIRKLSRSDYALSVTGIAGPSGGTKAKPVGLVYIALSGPECEVCLERKFTGDRQEIREKSALFSLDLLRRHLLKKP